MGIRFRRDSDEESCDKSIRMNFSGRKLLCGCMRTKGHVGECIAIAFNAAKADGVCVGCRKSCLDEHRTDCLSMDCLVECAFCYQRFSRAMNLVSYTQGADCASSIHVWPEYGTVLLGGYGSAYDYEVFKFVGEPVGFKHADPVCDGCIRSFLEQRAMKKVRGEFGQGRR